MTRILILFVLALGVAACTGTPEYIEQDGTLYTLESAEGLPSGLKVYASLALTNPEAGGLTLKLVTKLPQGWQASPGALQLSTEDQVASNPVNEAQETQPGHFTAYFEPINNIDLYKPTGIKGDLRGAYVVNLGFIRQPNGQPLISKNLRFTLNEATLSEYLAGQGKESELRLMKLAQSSDDFYDWQITYLIHEGFPEFINKDAQQSQGPEEGSQEAGPPDSDKNTSLARHSVTQRNEEIVVNGVATNFMLYQEKERTQLRVRIVNHSLYELHLLPEQFTIKAGGQEYAPAKIDRTRISNRPHPGGEGYVVNQSERFICTFEYPIALSQEALSLSRLGLIALLPETEDKPLFYQDLIFQ